MSKRFQLKRTLATFTDLKNIFSAMKNLSVVETGKLSRFFEVHDRTLSNLEGVISDFKGSHGISLSEVAGSEVVEILILVGSERGFCGAFNDRIVNRFEELCRCAKVPGAICAVVVGSRLASKIEGDPRVKIKIAGSASVEEIPTAISELIDQLARWDPPLSFEQVRIVYNEESGSMLETRVLSPLSRFLSIEPKPYSSKVRLDLPQGTILGKLLEYYLLVLLEHLFSKSLMAEHRERLRLMEGAVDQLDKERGKVMTQMNRLRQEEITEEIEVILLNSDA